MAILDSLQYPSLLAFVLGSVGAVLSIAGASKLDGFNLEVPYKFCLLCSALFLALSFLGRYRTMLTIQKAQSHTQMWGWVTIPQGECWNVYMTSGKVRSVTGPEVITVWGDTIVQLRHFSAMHSQYLLIHFADGRSQILPGPVGMHLDPGTHKTISVKDALNLSDSEVLVVYRDDSAGTGAAVTQNSSTSMSRHLIRGPCLYIPWSASEWTQQFSWHGSVSNEPELNGRKVKGAVKFTKLRVCPEQTYMDVDGVRTKDDALVTVKVMLFYRLQDIDKMLKETHDPTADFINSLSSDVVEFVAGKSFEDFKSSTDLLNSLSAYPQLTSRAKGIGFEITKVVFRGYGAPQRLQKMHDDAIERRTKLALERENEEQEQKMQDLKLDRENDRLKKRRQMESDTNAHELQLQRAAHEAKQRELAEKREAHLAHLEKLKTGLSISSDQMATYLLASEQGPPGKLIQIVGKDGGTSTPSYILPDVS
jgi:Skp family chaperone for outer membrane proteins